MKRHILVAAVIPIAGLVAVTITDPTPKLRYNATKSVPPGFF